MKTFQNELQCGTLWFHYIGIPRPSPQQLTFPNHIIIPLEGVASQV